MPVLDNLNSFSNSVQELNLFIEENSIELYDFFISQSYTSISPYREQIGRYILVNYGIYRNLDFTISKNCTFIMCLLDVSERFGLHTEFHQLFNLANSKKIEISSRLKAASKFLVGIRNISDYSNRISDILDDLSISFLMEEDSEHKVIATLIHYYTEVFYNFGHSNINGVVEFRKALIHELSQEQRSFIYTNQIKEVLSLTLDNIDSLYLQIHNKLDEILERSNLFMPFNIEPDLIELDTEYAGIIESAKASFLEIRQLCAKLYSKVGSDEIFWSLQRGVKVLTEQNQLLAYINSYGQMHYAKVMSAFGSLTEEFFNADLEIYDWGCGQGLASVCFLEYLKNESISTSIKKITLIEPSEIALKRAALHVRKFNRVSEIITINKDLDSLTTADFNSQSTNTKFQLFSNILDIDLFSMSDLINNIKNNFKGLKLFVCVSPFVSDYKTQRLDDFVTSFEEYSDFEIILSITERKGQWIGTNWSRVIRVFKAKL
ncbi:hypothetical protein [Flavobacterium sp. N1719]|uniref:hypothetical protein n=1 Tax=Flavobacterium sp. N1719 TaxID=2885633 RepID=UPI002222EABF|nr:hypothetical protein [Flavobacterium sp. N1719]